MKIQLFISAALLFNSIAHAQTNSIQQIAIEANDAYEAGEYLNARILSSNACDRGHAKSCLNLGLLLEGSLGGEQNIPLAMRKYGAACKLNLKAGCKNFAKLSVRTDNSFEMRKKGLILLSENCKNKDYEACSVLGIESYKAKLYDNAKQFLTEACVQGHINYSCYNLGLSFEAGDESNSDQAIQYFDKACKLGYTKGCEKKMSISG